LARAIYRIAMTTGYRSIPYTSPYGPGALWIMTEAGLKDLFYCDINLHFLLLQKNTLANLYTTTYAESSAVANAPIDTYASLGLDVSFNPLGFFEVFAEPEIIFGPDLNSIELTIGGSILLDSVTILKEAEEDTED
jgi:hypothetical protein